VLRLGFYPYGSVVSEPLIPFTRSDISLDELKTTVSKVFLVSSIPTSDVLLYSDYSDPIIVFVLRLPKQLFRSTAKLILAMKNSNPQFRYLKTRNIGVVLIDEKVPFHHLTFDCGLVVSLSSSQSTTPPRSSTTSTLTSTSMTTEHCRSLWPSKESKREPSETSPRSCSSDSTSK
jgi:hypothetical protein